MVKVKKTAVAMADDQNIKEKPVKKNKRVQDTLPQTEDASHNGGSRVAVKREKKILINKSDEALVEVEDKSSNHDGHGEGGEQEKKKKATDANGCDVKEVNGNDAASSKKRRKKKPLGEENDVKTEDGDIGETAAQSAVKEGVVAGKGRRKGKMIKNKLVQSEPPMEKVKVESGEKEEGEKGVEDGVGKKDGRKGKDAKAEGKIKPMKKRKMSDESGGFENGETILTLKRETGEVVEGAVKKKKKAVVKTETKDEAQETETQEIQKKKKAVVKTETKEEAQETETHEIQKKKKKKKKAELAAAMDELPAVELPEEVEIQHNEKTKNKATNTCVANIKQESREPESKKKGVKEMRKKASEMTEEEQEAMVTEEGEPKKKKKKRTASSKGGEEEPLLQQTEVVEEVVSSTKGLKKIKRGKKSFSDVETETKNDCVETISSTTSQKKKGGGKDKKKIKVEKDQWAAAQTDVVFLSEKTGNKDEISINQERRVSLQMEVDKASQPATASGLGQWSTAQFQNSDQQQKFLRLMGGFKKAQPTGLNEGKANMALGKQGQQNLQQALLGQFESAQSRRMDFSGRGAGLGFTAPSNKKSSIDVDARRSVRFDE